MCYSLFECSILSVQCDPPDLWRHHGGKSKCPTNKQWEGIRADEACRYGVWGSKAQTEQDDRNKGTCWGDRGEMRGARERQGKHVEWVRIGTVPQGSVCRELSASLLLLSCHRNLILKSLLSITYVFYGQMLLELDRHQTDTNQRAAVLQGFYVSAKSKLQILGVKVQCLQLHTKY